MDHAVTQVHVYFVPSSSVQGTSKDESHMNLQNRKANGTSTQTPGMRLHPVAIYSKSHTSICTARDTMNAAGAIVIFVVLSATLFGPLLFSPKTDANSVGGSRTGLVEHPSSTHEIASSDRRDMTVDGMEQRRTISFLLRDQGKTVMQTIATEQEMVLDKVDHAKLANVVSISASAAILLGAFTAGKMAKRSLGHSAGGGVFVESDSNAGRISDDVAYDIANTSTASEISYGSFTSTWAGDLEKFDV